MRLALTMTCFGLALALPSCSSRQIYGGLAATQRNACFQYPDGERDRCLAAAEVSYDDYERQR